MEDSRELNRVWTLFISFMKIGIFTFGGGYAMIPLIQKEIIERRGWVEKEQFLELLTLAQSAPGPLALNASVFVGYKVEGYKGAFASTIGVIIPSFIIILLIAMFFSDFQDNTIAAAAFKGMRPAVVALIAAPVFGLAKGMGTYKIAIAVLVAAAVWRLTLSPVIFIVLGAAVGALYVWLKGRKENK